MLEYHQKGTVIMSDTITHLTIQHDPKTGVTGKVTFRCNILKTRKDRARNRNDKYARRELRNQLKGD
jgi:hypothetical protein